MESSATSIITLTINSIMYALYYFYIFVLRRHRYLAFWGFSWITYSLGYILYLMSVGQTYSIIFRYFSSFASSILLLLGTIIFFSGRIKRTGYVLSLILTGAVLVACITFSLYPDRMWALSMLTAVTLMIISVVSGLGFLISDEERMGLIRQITGWAFIIWGIHKGFYPFVSPDFYASESNYMSSIVLINVVNMTIILCYLDQSNRLLLEKEVQYRRLAESSEKHLANLEIIRRRFLAAISHELRTPITSIVGNLSIITDGIASDMEESRHYAGLSLEKALTLNTLIQDLFQMSTREAMEMQFKLNREEISVSDYFAQLDEKFRAEQDNPRIRIKVALSCKRRARDCPSLMIDRIRIEQVFNNLINNAVKNIPGEGKITISCGCADRAGMEAMDRGLLRIFVEDNGVGIEKEDIPYIFEMFYKKPNINQVQGTGIGLSISKEIIQSHGGRLFVESEAGAGAMFTIELEALRRAECISADGQYTIKPAVET